MGTSVNQRSPKTAAWDLVQRVYDNPKFPIENVLFQVWRAATTQEQGNLRTQLSEPLIGQIASAVGSFSSPAEAAQRVGQMVTEAKGSSLAFEIARRAAMQAAGKEGAGQVFAERLFAEATNYFVSRDISGHLNPNGRLSSISEIQAFKRQVTELAVNAVRRETLPAAFSGSDWPRFVATTVDRVGEARLK